jgi:uncharacterized membrane protein
MQNNSGFLFDRGMFSTIEYPGAVGTIATGVDNSGRIVGYYGNIFVTHGFLLEGGRFTSIDFPGATGTRILGINGLGQFVGDYSASGIGHAFLFDTRTFISFDVPGGDTASAFGINDLGQIVGVYSSTGVPGVRGFVAVTAIPEPSTTLSFVIGCVVCAFTRIRALIKRAC